MAATVAAKCFANRKCSIAIQLPKEIPKRAWSSIDISLHRILDFSIVPRSALCDTTGRLVKQPQRLPK